MRAPLSPANALILLPHGRDANIAAAMVAEAGAQSAICADLADVVGKLGDEVGVLILTEDVVGSADLRPLDAWLGAQPAWSDLPIVLLTHRASGLERNPAAARLLSALRNVTFLERPFHQTTFVSVVLTALNSRHRQYEARARLDELREGEQRLRQLNDTLEERVRKRTAELERAHSLILQEMAERQRAEEQLRQAQKMEALGQLTGGLAHDFNNLLMAILGNIDVLRRHVPDDPKALRLIDGALQGARRGAMLTQRLLAFARQQELEVKPLDLAALVRGMADLLERSTGPAIQMRLDADRPVPPVAADANQIELALLNFVLNARDAMPEGGTLTITVDRAAAAGDDALAAGAYVRLVVTDTGVGMDEATLRRAVEPFFSTKGPGKGTGLGLSTIHGLAVQLKGTLRLLSQPGRGTRAELWLPTTAGVVAEQPEAPPAAPTPAARTATILFVDDDALIAMSTVDMLEDLGHRVIQAGSGRRALELLRAHSDIDLLITDHAMPGMTGTQLAQAARALRPDLPILLATGYAELPEGADFDLPRLAKPYDRAELAARIGEVLKVAA